MESILINRINNILKKYKPIRLSDIEINPTGSHIHIFNSSTDKTTFWRVNEYWMKSLCIGICGKNRFSNFCSGNCEEWINKKKQCMWRQEKIIKKFSDVIISRYEIITSENDLSYKNEEDFLGHLNYYIIPKDFYKKIKNNIPQGIGVILYVNVKNFEGFKEQRKSEFKWLDPQQEKKIMLSMLKKMVKNFDS
ncbi:hypothetical protein [Phascolarctobacterium sp.]